MTKNIIVPTDFSENAFIAAKYACQIALDKNYNIQLLHCYNSNTSIFDEKLNSNEPTNEISRGDLLMKEWKGTLQQEYPTVSIEGECRNGLISEILPKIAVEPKFSFIVMGSNGLDKNDSPLFGSITSQIATASHVPVIAVPNDSNGFQSSKAAILTNFKDDELESLADFISFLKAPLVFDVIHVYQISDDVEMVKKNINDWCEKIKNIAPSMQVNAIIKSVDYSNKAQDTISEVINIIIDENKYDIVLVTKTRKSFFDKWFARSISKEVILKLETVVFFDNN